MKTLDLAPRVEGPGPQCLHAEALAALSAALGDANLEAHPKEVDLRSRDTTPKVHLPLAYAYPGSRQEVQEVVRIANRFGLALWPCSKGKNWGYGGATPCQEGAVVVVLERMNRILEVNEELGYAVIEPGVTYRQLHQHLREQRHRLWADCTDGPPEGSVLGNALDRGIGETPYGDHFGCLCGLEAVLPDGAVLRTGGGPPGSRVWHTYKWGRGPYLEGLLSQGNFGIVTQGGIWLMPQPESYRSIFFELRAQDDLPKAVDAIARLARRGVLESKLHLINEVTTRAVLCGEGRNAHGGPLRLPPWSFGAAVYGSAGEVRAHLRSIKSALGGLGRLVILSDPSVSLIRRLFPWPAKGGGLAQALGAGAAWLLRRPPELLEALPPFHELLKGEPTDYFVRHAYGLAGRPKPDRDPDPARDGCGCAWCAPLAPATGAAVTGLLGICKSLFSEHGFDFYAALMLVNPRTFVALLSIPFDSRDAGQRELARRLQARLYEVVEKAGYPQYRMHAACMGGALAPNDPARLFLGRLKQAADPRGILAPGKYGVAAPE